MIVEKKKITKQWYKMLGLAKAYRAANGNLDIPARYIDQETGSALGAWIANQRYARRPNTKKQTITPEQIQMLDELGMDWGRENGNIGVWDDYIRRLKEYKAAHGDCRVPKTYVDPRDGFKLGKLVIDLRHMARGMGERQMPSEYRQKLDELEFDWGKPMADISKDNWEKGIATLTDFLRQGGKQSDITVKYVWNGFNLGAWLHTQIYRYRGAKSYSPISPERVQELKNLGIVLDPAGSFPAK